MRDLIWIAALAAALAGVWFFMARLDRLLRDSAQPPEEEAGLRLGVERGLDAAALRSVLGEVRLEFGTEQELRLAKLRREAEDSGNTDRPVVVRFEGCDDWCG